MSLDKCLPGLVADGKLSKEQADEAHALFTDLQQDLRRQFGDQAADAMASDATLKVLDAAAVRKRFLAGKTIEARQRIGFDMQGYDGGNGGSGGGDGPIDPRAGPAFFGGDGRAGYSNVEGRMRAVRGRAHATMDGILAKHSSNAFGQIRDKAGLTDLVREAFGEDSGNASARELVQGWRDSSEMLRQRFNAAGGDIGKLDNWGMPQYHEPRLVRKAGFEAWRGEILPRLDRERMLDKRTGLPISDQQLELALKDIFENVRSDGWASRNPGAHGGGSLANQRSDSRFLIFKSADDWLAYAEKFGTGNAFDAMMGHVDGMSRDIAMMEVLGPNPEGTVRWMKDTIEQSAQLDTAPDSKAVDKATAATRKIDRMYKEVTGELGRPESRKLALGFSAMRSWQTATKLGGAMLSAVSDMGFQWSARRFNGLGGSILRDYAKLFRVGALEDQKLAVRRGLIAEEWAHRTAAQHRYMGEELTGEVSKRLAESVLRLSGLSRFTQAGRWAFGMEFLGTLTEARHLPFDQLDPNLRGAFERYGMHAGDWDTIRSAPTVLDRGVEWIDPPTLPDRELGDKLLEMIGRETDYAVPVPDLATRAMVNSVAPPGTLHGELVKSAFLFKSFGISVMAMQGQRIMQMAGANRLRYAAGLTIATTLMGGLGIWLKDLAAGRDPRNAADVPFYDEKHHKAELNPGFWGQALAQGGGFGIFGDFVRSSTNRAGGGLAGSVAGPVVSDATDIAALVTSKNKTGAALKFARGQIPGGSLWYARLAFDRAMADQVQEALDPHYRQSWRRMNKWAQEQGTEYWWKPGQMAPGRAPDLSKALGNQAPSTGSMTQ